VKNTQKFFTKMTEPIYSAEQIKIPPELPDILKNYAKFVIKSNPEDILQASAEYAVIDQVTLPG
jgi:hypothetical protein